MVTYLGRSVWVFVGVLLALSSSAERAGAEPRPDLRALFFEELLTPGSTYWTPRFDDYRVEPHEVEKLDLLWHLSEVARRREQELRGVLIVGPAEPRWHHRVLSFVHEGSATRVIEVVYSHTHIEKKATLLLSESEYGELRRRLGVLPETQIEKNVAGIRHALEQADFPERLALEYRANFVFADVERESFVFGWIPPPSMRALDEALSRRLALRTTYKHGEPERYLLQRRHPSLGAWLMLDMTREPVPALDRVLTRHGFGSFDQTAVSYGFGLGGQVWRRLWVEYDMSYGQRWASHRSLASHAILSSVRMTPRLGIVAYEHYGFSMIGLLGVRGERRVLAFAAQAVSRPEEEYFAMRRYGLVGEAVLGVEYYLPRDRRRGIVVGTRVGYAKGLVESRFVAESPIGDPSTLSGGAFTAFYVGFSEAL